MACSSMFASVSSFWVFSLAIWKHDDHGRSFMGSGQGVSDCASVSLVIQVSAHLVSPWWLSLVVL